MDTKLAKQHVESAARHAHATLVGALAEVLASVTAHGCGILSSEGRAEKVVLSKVIVEMADKLGDVEGVAFLAKYKEACGDTDTAPLVEAFVLYRPPAGSKP